MLVIELCSVCHKGELIGGKCALFGCIPKAKLEINSENAANAPVLVVMGTPPFPNENDEELGHIGRTAGPTKAEQIVRNFN